jgi:hypothetical protein
VQLVHGDANPRVSVRPAQALRLYIELLRCLITTGGTRVSYTLPNYDMLIWTLIAADQPASQPHQQYSCSCIQCF